MNWLAHFPFARAFLRHAYDHRLITGEEYVDLVRGVNQTEKEFYACRSKDRFPTFNAARGAIAKKHIDRRSKFEIYPCELCHGFHFTTHNSERRRIGLAIQQRENGHA